MKTFRYASPYFSIDFTMPSWFFYFFKRLVKIKYMGNTNKLSGNNLDYVVFDEASEGK